MSVKKNFVSVVITSIVIAVLLVSGSTAVFAQQPQVQAVIAVERAPVFPTPNRSAEPFTYLYERERVPVMGQHIEGTFLLVTVDGTPGWVLLVQVEIEGDLGQIPVVGDELPTPTATFTPFQLTPVPSDTAVPAGPTSTPQPTRTALPTRTPLPDLPAISPDDLTDTPTPVPTMVILPGEPPPLEITLPTSWDQIDLLVPFESFDGVVQEVPLTIYFGPLPDGSSGLIYLYWGFRSNYDSKTNKYNLWADGVQILHGSFVGDCQVGVYDQETFAIGELEGTGAFYAASQCEGENDTAGWFAALRVYDGGFAFFVAVEPFDALSENRLFLQNILDSVEFTPPTVE